MLSTRIPPFRTASRLLQLCLLTGFLTLIPTSTLVAQVWVDWNDVTGTNLVAAPHLGANDVEEKDYCVADFDQDGDPDLVCVRKLPFTTFGDRENVYFENQFGVLTDRTSLYIPDFQTGDNGRDVMPGDFNGDGWLDIIVANAGNGGSNGQQPRIFINQGLSGGQWQGFNEEANRLPFITSMTNTEPNACAIGVGDVTGNGVDDLYLVDYLNDVEDRLLINNGGGFFTDQTTTRLPAGFNVSAFATAGMIADMNNDGYPDIIKNTTPEVKIAYNDGTGNFLVQQDLNVAAAYHFDVGDLNNDGRNDLFIVQDGQDQFMINNSPNGTIPVTWTVIPLTNSPLTTGFGGNVHIADIDGDNDQDIAIADADTDVPSCARRTAYLRSDGLSPIPTIEDPYNQVWEPFHMLGVYDLALADFNGDGALDIVIGHCAGTNVFFQTPPTPAVFPVDSVTCVQSGVDVALTWNNGQSYTNIEVRRSGTTIANLPFGTTTYLDTAPGAGSYAYTIVGHSGTQSSAPTSCLIFVSTVEPVIAMNCAQFNEDVQVTWQNQQGVSGAAYTGIEVRRNGFLVASMAGTATQYTDIAPGPGLANYTVEALIGTDYSPPTTCTLNVAPTNSTDLVLDFVADDGGSTNSAFSLEESLIGNGKVVNRAIITNITDLPALNIDMNDYERVWVELGTFPSNKTLSFAEGQALADYVNDGIGGDNVYISGGDTFFFDPQTPIHDMNGVTATSDGFGGVFDVEGIDGPSPCNGEALEHVLFDGEDSFIDRLTTPLGTPLVEANVNTGAYLVSAYFPVGEGAIISSSLELGGVGAPHDRQDLVGAYLDCFDQAAPPFFLRGDCDNDGQIQLTDPIFMLNYLFAFGPIPSCLGACDFNDNGAIQLPDAIQLLNYLFASGPPPEEPFPVAGWDYTWDTLACP